MKKAYITTNSRQTQKLGEVLTEELRGGEIICLSGELGSGKTTFAQGILRGLKAREPCTSPTFVVMKHYKKKFPISNFQFPNKSQVSKFEMQNIYHIDCYRIGPKDILDLGWEEIIADKRNVIIVEWAERIKKIVPRGAVWVKFEHINKNKRKIVF